MSKGSQPQSVLSINNPQTRNELNHDDDIDVEVRAREDQTIDFEDNFWEGPPKFLNRAGKCIEKITAPTDEGQF
eukprot:601054-Rhodomonas_salina.1